VPRTASGKNLSVKRIVKLARSERRRSDISVRLSAVGRGPALSTLATSMTDTTDAPSGLSPAIDVVDIGAGTPHLVLQEDDVVVICAEGLSAQQLQAVLGEAHDARSGVVVALPSSAAAGPAARAAFEAGALSTELEVFEPGRALEHSRFADALADAADQRGPRLAAGLPWLRPAVVARLVRRTAMENALIGALVFIPGADMPVMTLNQVRMVLRIAAAYGRGVEPSRAPEVVAVVGAGLGLRALAHQGLRFVPVAGWALKGAIGFGGTIALGRAAAAFYQSGAAGALGGVDIELPEALERRLPKPVSGLLRDRLGLRRDAAEEPADATNEAHDEPLTRISEHVDHAEGGLWRGG